MFLVQIKYKLNTSSALITLTNGDRLLLLLLEASVSACVAVGLHLGRPQKYVTVERRSMRERRDRFINV